MSAPISLPRFPAAPPLTVTDLLRRARATVYRLEPHQAFAALREGAVLVDIRPALQRAAEGEVPHALHVERSELEWRFDPASDNRLPQAAYDLQPVALSSRGNSSSLAAAALQQLGIVGATDVVGGFHGWRSAGLPVAGPAGRGGLALVPAGVAGGSAGAAPAGGPLEVRPEERRAYLEGRELELTRLEFDLLTHLVATPHRVHTRSALRSHLWEGRAAEGSRTIDIHVHRLRNKLGDRAARGLQTVRGVGYRWSPPDFGAA